MTDIAVGGLTPMTSIDLPGRLAAVVFCQGCPWRCGYCHNSELRPRHNKKAMDWSRVMGFLQGRRGLLDGVVFSGGEPTLQSGLVDAVREVKALGFQVGLHTAGPYPRRLERLLPWLDWVGMDIKAPFHRYEAVTGVFGSGVRARESVKRILGSGLSHEFRTTVDHRLLREGDLLSLARSLASLGVRQYALQACRYGMDWRDRQPIAENLATEVGALFEVFTLRTD
ncbi:MAG: anaerobic ribonucleoside-triphosphate reductase activating protein [Gammaproteobacteria bacterium]|nr:anaerobic ribonucleoside-triphosphate reductase activating protein [Gammaproteobacteria bacterium]